MDLWSLGSNLDDFNLMLKEYETLGSSNTDITKFTQGRANILVGSTSLPCHNILSGMMKSPQGTSALSAIQGKLCWDQEQSLDEVKLLWDIRHIDPFPTMWLLDTHVAEVDEEGWDFAVRNDSTVVPVTCNNSDQIHVLELFGGGFGGWSSSVQHLKDSFQVQAQVLAVEYDLSACHTYAVSKRVPIFNGYQKMSPDFFIDFSGDAVIHGSVTGKEWLSAIGCWHADIVCMSAPGPPWSTASKSPGLTSMDGLLFPETACVIRWLQPSIILVENVAGFNLHSHKSHVMRTFAMAGYRLVWGRVLDLKEHAACHRPRWLAMFHRCDDPRIAATPFQMWPVGKELTPCSRDAILTAPWVDEPQLQLNAESLNVLSDPRFAPSRTDRTNTRQQVLEKRCFDGRQILPVFLASYGKQHCFSEAELKQRGCLAHIFQCDSHRRFWHPFEIMLIHGLLQPAFICKQFDIAWKHVGNQISIPHSLLLVGNAFRMLKSAKFEVSMDRMFELMHQKFFRASAWHIQELHTGFLITHDHSSILTSAENEADRDFVQKCGAAFLPKDNWWDLHGFHQLHDSARPLSTHAEIPAVMSPVTDEPRSSEVEPITPTMPFQPVITAVLQTRNAQRALSIAAGLSSPDILQVWEGSGQVVHDPPFSMKILLDQTVHSIQCASKLIVCFLDGVITVYKLRDGESLYNQVARLTNDRAKFDMYGPLNVGQAHLRINAVFDQQLQHGTNPLDVITTLAALSLCQVTYIYRPQADVWAIQMSGENSAVCIVTKILGSVLTPQVLQLLGRDMVHSDCELHFIPAGSFCPAPPRIMNHVFSVMFARLLFDGLSQEAGRNITVKWNSRALWKGKMPLDITAETMTRLLQHALSAVTRFAEQRLVHKAKQFASGPLGNILQDEQTMIMLHVVQEMWGGTGPIASKNQLKQQIRNSIAGSLIGHNIELTWIHENTCLETAVA